jgi:hypothetical protein
MHTLKYLKTLYSNSVHSYEIHVGEEDIYIILIVYVIPRISLLIKIVKRNYSTSWFWTLLRQECVILESGSIRTITFRLLFLMHAVVFEMEQVCWDSLNFFMMLATSNILSVHLELKFDFASIIPFLIYPSVYFELSCFHRQGNIVPAVDIEYFFLINVLRCFHYFKTKYMCNE